MSSKSNNYKFYTLQLCPYIMKFIIVTVLTESKISFCFLYLKMKGTNFLICHNTILIGFILFYFCSEY